jgi:iron complex outermembrane receptor protein
LNGAYLNTKVRDVLLPDGVSFVDRDLPQSPKFSGSTLARYDRTIGGGTGFVQVDANVQNKSCFSVLCAPTDREGGFAVANARIGYAVNNISLQVFVNNLGNRQYRVFASDVAVVSGNAISVFGRPRTIGATLEFKFGN